MAAVRLKALQDRLRAINDELRHTAGTDSLTGLPNRRVAAEHLDRLIARARRHDRPFALVLADVDHFKAVNDAYGHAVGDEALVGIARRLADVCRRGDMLARWGGEELILLSEEESRGGADALARRLVESLSAEPVEAGEHRLTLTVSVGWSAWRPGDEADELLARADRALYAAKATGRGRASSDAA
jgi:two-component system cell cycle response regulator